MFYNNLVEFFAQRSPLDLGANLWIRCTNGSSTDLQRAYGELTFVTQKQEGSIVKPTIQFDDEAAQQLMDELWCCGYRPREGTGSAGALAATERHLADIRKLLKHTMGVKDGL